MKFFHFKSSKKLKKNGIIKLSNFEKKIKINLKTLRKLKLILEMIKF